MRIQIISTTKIIVRLCFICALVILGCLNNISYAQIFENQKMPTDIPVGERLPEEFRAPGLVSSGFIVHPKISLQGKYDSNILATNFSEKSDYSVSLKPSVTLLKELRDNIFLLNANADIERFLDRTKENSNGYDVSLTNKIVGNSHWTFPSSFSYKKITRKRETPLTTLTPDKRLDIKSAKAEIGVTRHFNRLSLSLFGNYSSVQYEDGVALDQVTPTVYSDNNRDRYGGLLRFRYDLPRGAKGTDFENVLFTNLIYGKKKYKKKSFQLGSFSGVLADHHEYGFLTGFNTNYKGLLFANIGAGLRHQSFDNSTLTDTNTTEIYADIDYNFRPKLTLGFGAKRDIDQDNGLTQGVVTSDYHFGADYELSHDLYVGAELGYTNYEFDRLNREDDDYYTSLYVKKFINKNVESMLKFNYRDRQSNALGREFDRFDIIFSLTGKM